MSAMGGITHLLRRFVGLTAGSVLVAQCASTQLNYNTLDLSHTVDTLLIKQVLYNLSNFIDNPASIPTQVNIAAGTVSTTNSIAPSVAGFPIQKSSTVTQTVAQAAATTVTNASAVSQAAASLGATANDTWSQTWTLDPITDPDELRRMRALYQYAVCRIADTYARCSQILYNEYPVQTTTKTTGNPQTTQTIRDPRFMALPDCVLCAVPKAGLDPQQLSNPLSPANATLNPVLVNMPSGWIATSPSENHVVDLGAYGNHELFIRDNMLNTLSEFTLLILSASQSSSSGGTSANGPGPKALIILPGNFR